MATPLRAPEHVARRTWVWVVAASLAVVVVWAVLALRPTEPHVAVIGDSITVFATTAVNQELHGAADTDIQAVMGKRIDEMLPALKQEVAAHPQVVVVNLGTNDVLQAQIHPDWQPGFLRMVAALSQVPCVGITTISTILDGPTAVPSVSADIDAAILHAAARHHNFHLIDWNGAVHGPNGMSLLIPDHVHPTEAGSMWLAAHIRALVTHGC
jgi:lysophospholipase L1-like esterase